MEKEELPTEGKVLVVDARLSEVRDAYQSVSALMREMIAELECGTSDDIKKVQTQLQHLHGAYLIVKKAEDKIYDQATHDLGPGDIDFDEVRKSIGSRLDKLRHARSSD